MVKRLSMIVAAAALLSGCQTAGYMSRIPETDRAAVYPARTATQRALAELPPPTAPVAIAVYGFTDQTGQFKPSDVGQTLSRAVTQGASSMLVKALHDTGQRRWFMVVEREQLKNLLQERQIIREMRERYLGERETNPQALPSLLFAGVLLEGGVIGYDTNTLTGGAGAGFLGVSASTQYRQDTVTVYMRAISVRTGEVLASVTASKTIASTALGVNAFRYVGFKQLLEAETGFTTNEPDQLALQQAIEKALYGLIMEGAQLKLWSFADPASAAALFGAYALERDGIYSDDQIRRAESASPGRAPPKRAQRSTPPHSVNAGSPATKGGGS